MSVPLRARFGENQVNLRLPFKSKRGPLVASLFFIERRVDLAEDHGCDGDVSNECD